MAKALRERKQAKEETLNRDRKGSKQESKSKYESSQESRNLCLQSNNKTYRGNERGTVHTDMHVDLEICLHVTIKKMS